jgi:ornithine cyclodeaminase/alanine dehydrogenase-like protein (mu-crystallin family)
VNLPYYDAEAVRAALPFERAMRAIEESLRADVDPEHDGPRIFADAPDGEFLLMPAHNQRFSGLKALTIAPNNPGRGLEKIQGVYVLYSSDTLAPVALMEGSSLTAIRTPAVAVSAIRQLAALAPAGDELPESPRVLVFGVGVQGRASVHAVRAAFPSATFELVGRRPARVQALRDELVAEGVTVEGIAATQAEKVAASVASADIIICATTATTPLFDGSLVKSAAIVAAFGTHGHDAREIDDALVARADLVVEGRASAERENGNLHTFFSAAEWKDKPPANVRDLARGNVVRRAGHPALFTGVGMSWEDLVCATVVYEEGTAAR